MRAANGAGLAANQIGEPVQVCVIEVRPGNPRYPYKPLIPLTVLVNPVVEPLTDETLRQLRGLPVGARPPRRRRPRSSRCGCGRSTADGDPVEQVVRGLSAGTFQHETDHLARHGLRRPRHRHAHAVHVGRVPTAPRGRRSPSGSGASSPASAAEGYGSGSRSTSTPVAPGSACSAASAAVSSSWWGSNSTSVCSGRISWLRSSSVSSLRGPWASGSPRRVPETAGGEPRLCVLLVLAAGRRADGGGDGCNPGHVAARLLARCRPGPRRGARRPVVVGGPA